MTIEQKATELVLRFKDFSEKYYSQLGICIGDDSKLCALIAVDEILEEIKSSADKEIVVPRIIYWEKVKQEIKKL